MEHSAKLKMSEINATEIATTFTKLAIILTHNAGDELIVVAMANFVFPESAGDIAILYDEIEAKLRSIAKSYYRGHHEIVHAKIGHLIKDCRELTSFFRCERYYSCEIIKIANCLIENDMPPRYRARNAAAGEY